LSRATESRGGSKRPQLSDLRESGAIEQDADLVAFIHRPEYYGFTSQAGEEPVEGLAEFIIAKHRNGSVEDVKMRFIKEQAKFTNWDQINTGMNSGAPFDQYEEIESAPFQSSASVLQSATNDEFAPF
jgi:replicative DNA helicase